MSEIIPSPSPSLLPLPPHGAGAHVHTLAKDPGKVFTASDVEKVSSSCPVGGGRASLPAPI